MDTLRHLLPERRKTDAVNVRLSGGFTLIELITVVAIAAILGSIAAPSFTSFIVKQKTKSVASELSATMTVARGAAIARNANVTVSPNLTATWASGWRVLDASGAVLDNRGAAAGVTITGGPASVIYQPSGRLQTALTQSFVISASAAGTTVSRCVSVDLTGRPYMQKGATSCN